MYTLYYAPGAASLAVHLALLELDAPHQLERLDLQARQHKSPAYLKLNPNGVVPTLLVDGQPVYECAALLLLLAERHPGAGLAPPPGTPARAPYLQWMVHFANTLQPAFRAWFYPAEPAGEEAGAAAQESARLRIEACWDRLNAHLAHAGPYLCGAQYSMADMLGTMLMRWSRNMPRPAHTWPTLAKHAATMKSRPAFKEVYAREGLSDWT